MVITIGHDREIEAGTIIAERVIDRIKTAIEKADGETIVVSGQTHEWRVILKILDILNAQV